MDTARRPLPCSTARRTECQWTSVVFALARDGLFLVAEHQGIEESSEKALRVMQITTVMVVILLAWSAITLVNRAISCALAYSWQSEVQRRSPGFPARHQLRDQDLAKKFGMFGILIAFGHSVLAMSGEESLAQVNRELAHPKLKNLKRAAIIIAIYSFIFTGITALLFGDDHPGRRPRSGLQGQPDLRPGDVHVGPAILAADCSADSSWWLDS